MAKLTNHILKIKDFYKEKITKHNNKHATIQGDERIEKAEEAKAIEFTRPADMYAYIFGVDLKKMCQTNFRKKLSQLSIDFSETIKQKTKPTKEPKLKAEELKAEELKPEAKQPEAPKEDNPRAEPTAEKESGNDGEKREHKS